MKFSVILVLFAVSYVMSEPIVLNKSNFHEKTRSGTWFVKWYAPWCGHCQTIAPAWNEISNEMQGINVAKIDGSVDEDLASMYGVSGFPTMQIIKGGYVFDFTKSKLARTKENLVGFANGGWRLVSPSRAPGIPLKYDDIETLLVAAQVEVVHIATKKIIGGILIALGSLFVGMLIGSCCAPSKKVFIDLPQSSSSSSSTSSKTPSKTEKKKK
eukprot:TRINITY_DN4249_c0_g3_i1.p1 TRINITY_DN4249_c0_g3~~TRINITY_DN4249_c0_g3_i1.p1  ORF type:complete len:213 (+),score=62.32 TRINITY_DN4249_c0_g3_i1:107-745(+)